LDSGAEAGDSPLWVDRLMGSLTCPPTLGVPMRMYKVTTFLAAGMIGAVLTGCGGSTSGVASEAASAASDAKSAASVFAGGVEAGESAAQAGWPQVCTQVDAVMENNPDANPTATAASLNAIAATMPSGDATVITNLANAYTAVAADPSTANQEALKTAASAAGAACQSATQAASPSAS